MAPTLQLSNSGTQLATTAPEAASHQAMGQGEKGAEKESPADRPRGHCKSKRGENGAKGKEQKGAWWRERKLHGDGFGCICQKGAAQLCPERSALGLCWCVCPQLPDWGRMLVPIHLSRRGWCYRAELACPEPRDVKLRCNTLQEIKGKNKREKKKGTSKKIKPQTKSLSTQAPQPGCSSEPRVQRHHCIFLSSARG